MKKEISLSIALFNNNFDVKTTGLYDTETKTLSIRDERRADRTVEFHLENVVNRDIAYKRQEIRELREDEPEGGYDAYVLSDITLDSVRIIFGDDLHLIYSIKVGDKRETFYGDTCFHLDKDESIPDRYNASIVTLFGGW